MADESAAMWTEKMGKWSTKSVKIMNSRRFRIAMLICFELLRQLQPLLSKIMKKREPGTASSLARLVYYDCEHIQRGLNELCKGSEWIEFWNDLSSQDHYDLTDVEFRELKEAVIVLALKVYTQYDRRIATRIQSWPYQLLTFAIAPPDAPSTVRQLLCLKLIATPLKDLHLNAQKVI